MSARAGALDLGDDRFDLLVGGGLFHHDHHRWVPFNARAVSAGRRKT
jgi:hypothetical protein